MVNFPGRDRRRRVLKDEVLAATVHHTQIGNAEDVSTSDAPRYSEAAGVEHHPQITDFVPRRYRTIATIVLAGVAVTASLSALQMFVLPLAESSGLSNANVLGVSGAGGFASWIAAVLLLIASVTCLITYSLRRHRIDDFRGRYRVWRGAAFACLMMSAISVTGFHHLIAAGMTHLTGWTALREGAVWWFLLPGLPMIWIGIRAILDVRECRLAASLLVTAALSYVLAAVSYLHLVPFANPEIESIVVGASTLMGHWLLLAGMISYARFVILDAQGLIPIRKHSATKRAGDVDMDELEQLTRPTASSKPEPKMATVSAASRTVGPTAKAAADHSRWVDGSRPDRRRFGDEEDESSSSDDRRLSKAERKRLRKIKSDGRAA